MKNRKAKQRTIDLGVRKIGVMNSSKVMTLPKPFTENYVGPSRTVQVSMSEDGKLILTPVEQKGKKGGQRS